MRTVTKTIEIKVYQFDELALYAYAMARLNYVEKHNVCPKSDELNELCRQYEYLEDGTVYDENSNAI